MAEKDVKDVAPEENTVAKDIVVTKYKMAAEIVNDTLRKIIDRCEAGGAMVQELCEFGDKQLSEETAKVFKKEKDMKKGIAFPTCISVNNCICHFSPLKSEPDLEIKPGDIVKIDLGAHIDGFSAVVAHTVVIGASKDNKVTGRKADVILAAHHAAEAALRLVKPGNENFRVTDAIQKVTESYKCKPIEGMLSHQLLQHIIDGKKAIIQNPTEAQRKDHEKCEFEVHEVYAVDVLVSTGDGKFQSNVTYFAPQGREMDTRTTVYKLKKETIYNLKMKASRQFYSEVDKKFGCMAFSLRSFEDEKKAKMGIVECVKHSLIEPFSVLYEREGELVAQFKFTLLLMPNGPMKITGLSFDESLFESENSVTDEEMKSLLASSTSRRAAKKKKKKAEKATAEAAIEDMDEELTADAEP